MTRPALLCLCITVLVLLLEPSRHHAVEAAFTPRSSASRNTLVNPLSKQQQQQQQPTVTTLYEQGFFNLPNPFEGISVPGLSSEDDFVENRNRGGDNREPFDPSPEGLVRQAQLVLAADFGLLEPSLLDDARFTWMGPYVDKPLGKTDYLVAGRFFNLKAAFPDLNYRAHDFRLDENDIATIRCTLRTVGTMRGELRLRNAILPPTGQVMRLPPEAVTMTFDLVTGKLIALKTGYCLDRLVGNTRGTTGVIAAAMIAGQPVSDFEIYPPAVVLSRILSRPLKPLAESTQVLAPFPETVMIQLAKGVLGSNLGEKEPSLLSDTEFSYMTPSVGPIRKAEFLEKYAVEEFRDVIPSFFNYRVDPYDPVRVWVDVQPVGVGYVGALQAMSFAFDNDGFCTRITSGAVIDPSIGNGGGLGGPDGLKFAQGREGFNEFAARPLPRILGRVKNDLLSAVTGAKPTVVPKKAVPQPPKKPTPPVTKPPVPTPAAKAQQQVAAPKKPTPPKSPPPPPKAAAPMSEQRAKLPTPLQKLADSIGSVNLLDMREDRQESTPAEIQAQKAAFKEKQQKQQQQQRAVEQQQAQALLQAKQEEARRLSEEKAERARVQAEQRAKAQAEAAALQKKQAAELAEQRAKAKAQAAALKQKQAAEAQEKRAAAQAKAQEERAAAQAKAAAEQAAALEKQRVEQERAAQAAAKAAAAEAAKQRAEQERAEKAAAAAAAKERAEQERAAKAAAAAEAIQRAAEQAAEAKQRAAEQAAAQAAARQAERQRAAQEAAERTRKQREAQLAAAQARVAEAQARAKRAAAEAEAQAKAQREAEEARRLQRLQQAKTAQEKQAAAAKRKLQEKQAALQAERARAQQAKEAATAKRAAAQARKAAQEKSLREKQRLEEQRRAAAEERKNMAQQKQKEKAAFDTLASRPSGATFSLFGLTFGDDGDEEEESAPPPPASSRPGRKAPFGVPTISSWRRNLDGSVSGFVRGSLSFTEGERITTSPIEKGTVAAGEVVTTGSGSRYFLEDQVAAKKAVAEAKKLAQERALQDKKAAADARKAAQEKALQDKQRIAQEKKAAAEARKAAQQQALQEKQRIAQEKKSAAEARKAAQQQALQEKQRIAQEKKAAAEARKAAQQQALQEKQRIAQEKKAAAEARKAALDEKKRRADENKKLAQQQKKERAALSSLENNPARKTFSLFGLGGDDDGETSSSPAPAAKKKKVAQKAPRGVPTVTRWRKNRDGSISGLVSGSPLFTDGERITTSKIAQGTIEPGEVVTTGSGSRYFLA